MNYYPFLITLISGLCTLIGYLFIYIKKDQNKIIKSSLALASGVMICISITELIPESINILNKFYKKPYIIEILSIIVGMTLPIITILLMKEKKGLYRIGILSAIAIIIHNIPEGIITYLSSINNKKLAANIAFAIAMHNIPEGITIAIPTYFGTKNKYKTFKIILISALSEPLGAILAHIFLKKIVTDKIIGITLLLVAGIMSYMSVIELLPKALKYKEKKKTIVFFIIGIIVMYISVKIGK